MGGSCSTGSKTTDPDKTPYGPKRASKRGSKRIKEDRRNKAAAPVKQAPVINSKPAEVVAPKPADLTKDNLPAVNQSEVQELTPRKRPPKKEYLYTPKSTIEVVQDTINAALSEEPGITNSDKPVGIDDIKVDDTAIEGVPQGSVHIEESVASMPPQAKPFNDSIQRDDVGIRDSPALLVEDQVDHRKDIVQITEGIPQRPAEIDKDPVQTGEDIQTVQKNNTADIYTIPADSQLQTRNDSTREFQPNHEKKSMVMTSSVAESNHVTSQKGFKSATREISDQQMVHTIVTSATIESTSSQRETVHTTHTSTRPEASHRDNSTIPAPQPETGRITPGIPSSGYTVTSQVVRQQKTERVMNSEQIKNTGTAGTESHMAIFDAMKALRSAKSTPAASPTDGSAGASGKFFSLFNTDTKIMSDILSQTTQQSQQGPLPPSAGAAGYQFSGLNQQSSGRLENNRNGPANGAGYQSFRHNDDNDSSKMGGFGGTGTSSIPTKIVI